MNPIDNPDATGAGSPPLEVAGRADLIETARVALERTRLRFPTKSLILVGLRGVGKTVLLDHIREQAERRGILTIRIEAPEQRSLPAMLAPQLRQTLLKLSRVEKARELAQRGLRALAGFAKALKAKYEDIEVGMDFDPEPGLADNGDLEHDLQDLLDAAGAAAEAAGTVIALFIDELQYVDRRGATGRAYCGPASFCPAAPPCYFGRCRPAATSWPDGARQVICRTPVRFPCDRPFFRSLELGEFRLSDPPIEKDEMPQACR